MPTLVKIGHDHFLVKNDAAAVAVIKAMAGALPLRRNYEAKGRDEFYPEEHSCEIGIVTVLREQILRCKPGSVEAESTIDRMPRLLEGPR